MTAQTHEESPTSTEQQEQAVIDYLKNQPDFFNRHPDLLAQLKLPHSNGNTVSLVERQVAALRDQASQSKAKLEELIAVARENEQLNGRLHQLTLSLIDSVTFDEVIDSLENMLHDDFQAEAVELHLFSAAEAGNDNNDLEGFRDLLDSAAPRCGRPPRIQLDTLFGAQAGEIQSAALIPLRADGVLGILAIGSQSEHRFHPGMGTDYLNRLGDIVSRTLKVVSEPGA